MSTLNIGEEGFWWFVGVVENRDDPKKMGRVQVRIHNIHSDKKTVLPTENIPWAIPLMPITSASSGQVGTSPTGIKVGTSVFGFFMDGRSSQNPVIVGTFPGIPGNDVQRHDVPAEAREINKVIKTPIGPEPASAYAAKYPFNQVTRTEAGHVVELDSTPGKERIHVFHKSGTYVEVDQTGRLVIKSASDRFDITVKDNNVYVGGDVNITVVGSANITCPTTNITGDVNISGSVTVTGSVTAPTFHGTADRALDGLDN